MTNMFKSPFFARSAPVPGRRNGAKETEKSPSPQPSPTGRGRPNPRLTNTHQTVWRALPLPLGEGRGEGDFGLSRLHKFVLGHAGGTVFQPKPSSTESFRPWETVGVRGFRPVPDLH